MKIVFITPWYPDEKQEHAGIFIQRQAQALAVTNDVVVIAAKIDYSTFSFFKYSFNHQKHNGVDEYRIKVSRSIPLLNQVVYLCIATWVACKILKGFKVDIVNSFIGYPGAILGWLIGGLKGVSVIHTEHTRLQNNYRSFWHKSLTRFGMRRADKLTAVSNWLANQLQYDIKKEVLVVPNMIDEARFLISRKPSMDVFHIGFLGSLNTNVKGLDHLLTAFATLDFPCHLHIGGAGNLLDSYKMQAKSLGIGDRCTFYGFIKVVNVPSFFQQLHTFVCSSRFETFNVSLIEAMACGIPVVSTKCGGPEDFVSSINGYLVDIERGETLQAKISLMRKDYDSFSSFAIREFVVNTFSSSVIINKIQLMYSSLVFK